MTTPSVWNGPRPSTTPGGSYAAPAPRRRNRVTGAVLAAVAIIVGLALITVVATSLLAHTHPRRDQAFPRPPIVRDGGPIPTYSTPVTEAMKVGVVLISGVLESGRASGTGIIISSDGLVLTNYHVVSDTGSLSVQLATDGTVYSAKLLGRNVWQDVALLQLDGASGLTPALLDSDGVNVGDRVVAVGNASGGGVLVASGGGVTGLDTSIMLPTAFGNSGTDRLGGLIESSAGAVPGYSGGPTFDAQNEVIGLTSAGREVPSPNMTTYTIPIDTATAIADDIVAGRQSEQTRVGPGAYLGISLGGDNKTVVTQVVPGGPAAASGITAGSTITGFRGKPVTTANGLLKLLESSDPDERVELVWVDPNGQSREGFVTLGTSPTN